KRRVETRNVTNRTRCECIGSTGFALVRMQEGVLGPAVGFDGGDEIVACQQSLPKRFVRASWHAERETDHRDRPAVSAICHMSILEAADDAQLCTASRSANHVKTSRCKKQVADLNPWRRA